MHQTMIVTGVLAQVTDDLRTASRELDPQGWSWVSVVAERLRRRLAAEQRALARLADEVEAAAGRWPCARTGSLPGPW